MPKEIIFSSPKNFDPAMVFDCGQCFRFDKTEKGSYAGVAKGKYIEVEKRDGDIFLSGASEDDRELWEDFFDMKLDYTEIGESFSFDKTLSEAYKYSSGIRILHQDEFETLISFIISQNNNIPRIKGIISNLCKTYGEPVVDDGSGDVYHTFPTPEKIVEAGEEGMKNLRMGFRAGYVYDAASKVLSGETDLNSVYAMDTESALKYLMRIKGVGLKVASCTALFAFRKYDAFPIDVWVKRILDKYYDGKVEASYFGKYGGIAQQYLFFYERCMSGVFLSK